MGRLDDADTALHRLFARQPIASLAELRSALGTRSRTTVFRVVRSVGYRTSFSHAGRYYTLEHIPKFDARGLWFYRDVGFSSQGTLRSTLVTLVDRSDAGCTHEELQAELKLRVHDTLRSLVHDALIGRERVEDVYVYVSTRRKLARAQMARRRRAIETVHAPAPLDPARTIEVLVAVIHHPAENPRAIVARLVSQGRGVGLEQVEQLFRRYELGKKTARSRSRPSPR